MDATLNGVTKPIARILVDTEYHEIIVAIATGYNPGSQNVHYYWIDNNGSPILSDIVYDAQNPVDIISYLESKYQLPEGYSYSDMHEQVLVTVELEGTL